MYTAFKGKKNMLGIPGSARIFLYDQPINMRKSFEGLCALIGNSFEEPLTSGSFFVFINRTRDLMKVLYWDGDGLALWYKRLEQGSFPKEKSLNKTLINRREFLILLEGIIPKKLKQRYSAF